MLRIKYERVTREWTQEDLAEAARVDQSDLSKFERGRATPTAGELERLAAVLGVPADKLMEEWRKP